MHGFAVFGIIVLCVIGAIVLIGILMNLPDIAKYLKYKAM